MEKLFIVVDGIKINIIRKPVKNVTLRINPDNGEVSISASNYISEQYLRLFAESRLQWIRERRFYRPRTTSFFMPENEGQKGFCYLWGKKCRLVIEKSPICNRVYLKEDGLLVLELSRQLSMLRKVHLLQFFLRQQLRNKLNEVIPICQEITNLKADEYRIKNMKTRWGTCNTSCKRVWLSLNLVHYSPDCLKYIVIHELTHLLEGSHNAIFKRYMDKFYPRWRVLDKKLALPLGTSTS